MKVRILIKMLHCQSFKEIVSTPADNCVGNSSVRKGFDRLESQAHARVILTHEIENDVNVCKQISFLLGSLVCTLDTTNIVFCPGYFDSSCDFDCHGMHFKSLSLPWKCLVETELE